MGDANTKHFHRCASFRYRKKIQFSELQNDNGVWLEWDKGLQDMMVVYFWNLFSSLGSKANPIIRNVRGQVIDDQNKFLLLPLKGHEI